MKKIVLLLAASVVVSIALFGCAQPAPPEEKTPATPAEAEKIVVCALFDPRIPVLKADAEAIKMAVDEINAQGGILGKQVEYIHEDTQRKVDVAISAYRSAVLEKDCKIVFLEGVSEEALAIIEEGARIFPTKPHIVISSQAAVGTTFKVIEDYDKYKFYFRNLPPDPELNYKVPKTYFEFAKNVIGAKKVALLLEDAAWTECARKGCVYESKFGKFESKPMREWVKEEYGMEVVYEANIAVGEKNFLPMLEEAARNGAEYIFVLSSWYTDTITLSKQWASSGAKDIPISYFGGPNQWAVFWDLTGGAALGTFTIMYDTEDVPPVTTKTREVVKKLHEKKLSVDMSVHYYYSEMYRVKEAIERVGSLDIDAIIKAMEEMEFKDHTALTPEYNYFGYKSALFHSYSGGPVLLAQFQCDGKLVYITPPELLEEAGFPEEAISQVNPDAYKSPAELREMC
ncbi:MULTISPECIES: ABC transporter substrate-binding protein [unclassified Archaeoglobus]|jgi:branched-chain amino acid transport system substrate-binding protein|uniref:ABC transporter substrate-binding protein n=1 Tax=unclassified Archaeoglobus TaxID=2643606 RepID=UPI0025B8576F|nr:MULTISPECIES: ABC transporter substrate-binding protein [unclassified Archaeoglobus]